MSRITLSILLGAVCLALLPVGAQADGFVIVRPTPDLPDPTQLAVRYHNVDIDVRDQVARVHIDQVFRNLNAIEVEGEYIFPIPDGAAVSDFVLYVDGEPIYAGAMDAREALRIYESLVRESRDPALLEYAGREMFRARIFPFPPGGERRVKLDYDHLIERQGGLYRFVYPLSTEKFSSRPLESAYVRIDIQADHPIRNAYCPSHSVEIEYLDEDRVRVTWEETDTKPDRDLVLYYALAEDAMDLRLIPYRPDRSEDGYFMLLASMGDDARIPAIAKDVVFVIDHSGSMDGEKIDQAREALVYCLEELHPEDRFNIVSFASSVDAYARGLREVTRSEIRDAVRFVRGLDAGGGTNISGALEEALSASFSLRRSGFVVFITDGLPTEGERDILEILKRVERLNGWEVVEGDRDGVAGLTVRPREHGGAGVRIFPFGVGYDVNAVFLDQLAEENAGSPSYVRPSEDLRSSIAGFYAQIAEPVLTDLLIEVRGARLRELQPRALPDLFRGGQLVLFGRYRGDGPVTLTLTGHSAGGRERYELSVDLPEREKRNDFVGRLWATRRVAALLQQIRLRGEEPELVDEVKGLGLRFGLATPYTSFLVDENQIHEGLARDYDSWSAPGTNMTAMSPPTRVHIRAGRSGEASLQVRREMGSGAAAAPLSAQTGRMAFEISKRVGEMADAESEAKISRVVGLRAVNGQTYRREGDVWKDVRCPDDARPIAIEMGSGEYFDLLAEDPELGAVFALGEEVVFEVDGDWYRIVPMT